MSLTVKHILSVAGLFMLFLSTQVKTLLGDDTSAGESGAVSIVTLTVIFVFLNFLAATQDIAVDGWALTMLSRLVSCWLVDM